jgi:low temperature requirement protein LtrA
MRFMLFAVMLLGLIMSAAIPEAYAEHGLVLAICYVVIQVGRTLFVLIHLGRAHVLTPNFRRILGWLCISGALWIAGGISHGHYRLGLWAAAVACEYISPMMGFWLPGLGRSRSTDWTIDGAHLAERASSSSWWRSVNRS